MATEATESMREEYLGDGVYVSVDTHTEFIWLRAPRTGLQHVVALEPPVLARLIEYACRQGFRNTIERGLKDAT